jgi:hypothetical protein
MSDYPFNNPNGDNMIITAGNDVYCLIAGLYEVVYKLNTTTKRWEAFPDSYDMYLPFAVGHQYLFSYQSRIYYGFRGDENDQNYVAWLNPVTGERAEGARFPGVTVSSPTTFSIGTKGYLLGGYSEGNVVNQFWEYDFITNQWTDKGNMPGGARAGGFAIPVGTKVYFGMGFDFLNLNGQKIKRLKNDWYSFDPGTFNGYAAVKANFPGAKRNSIKGFTINNKVYVGWGYNGPAGNFNYLTDFWEYNPDTNTWSQKSNCPASSTNRENINAFAFGNAGYLVKGWLAEYWRYSSTTLVPTNQ